MTVWTAIEDGCSQLVKQFFPTLPRVIAYQNGPEPITTYCMIDLKSQECVAREEASTFIENIGTEEEPIDGLIVREVYEATVNFTFMAPDGKIPHAGELMDEFAARLQHPSTQVFLDSVNFSLMRKGVIKRIPVLRETKWYSSYVIPVVFSYYVETTQVADYIASVDLTVDATSTIESTTITRGEPL